MSNPFFEHPILNSPYESPARHWELDETGQPTERVIESRRLAEFITPIPKPKKRKKAAGQQDFVFDEGKGLSTREQQYDATAIINEIRGQVNRDGHADRLADRQRRPQAGKREINARIPRGHARAEHQGWHARVQTQANRFGRNESFLPREAISEKMSL